MPEYPGPGLHIHWIEVEGPFPESWPTESYRRVFGGHGPEGGHARDAEKLNPRPAAARVPPAGARG